MAKWKGSTTNAILESVSTSAFIWALKLQALSKKSMSGSSPGDDVGKMLLRKTLKTLDE